MVLNLVKCYCLIINKDITNESIKSGKETLHAEDEQKLLGIVIDSDLNFQPYKVDCKNSQSNVKCPY